VIGISKDTKTIKVQVSRVVPDKMYGKRLHLHTVVFADRAEITEGLAVGKEVHILPCRRISKTKSWKVVSIVTQ
jgi:ribosomal protein S17